MITAFIPRLPFVLRAGTFASLHLCLALLNALTSSILLILHRAQYLVHIIAAHAALSLFALLILLILLILLVLIFVFILVLITFLLSPGAGRGIFICGIIKYSIFAHPICTNGFVIYK